MAEQGDRTVLASAVPNDCIGDFVRAMTRILSGSDAEQVRFYLEPGYASCHLRRNGANVCVFIEEPVEDKPVFEAAFAAVAFAKRALECRRLQALCGNGATWGTEYPGPEVECLLATTESVERSGSGQ